LPRPHVIETPERKGTIGSQILQYFIKKYYDEYDAPYSPTLVDRVNAKKLACDFSIEHAEPMIDKFFELKQNNTIPQFRSAPVTLSCVFFNRNELYRLLKEDVDNSHIDLEEKF
jgi:hypothetical protein